MATGFRPSGARLNGSSSVTALPKDHNNHDDDNTRSKVKRHGNGEEGKDKPIAEWVENNVTGFSKSWFCHYEVPRDLITESEKFNYLYTSGTLPDSQVSEYDHHEESELKTSITILIWDPMLCSERIICWR